MVTMKIVNTNSKNCVRTTMISFVTGKNFITYENEDCSDGNVKNRLYIYCDVMNTNILIIINWLYLDERNFSTVIYHILMEYLICSRLLSDSIYHNNCV